jgi:two-component system chemotaxis sensor kinase CheA
MQNGEKLTGLIEQAALAVNLIDFADVPGMKSFQDVLDQIRTTVGEIGEVPPQVLEQTRSKASNAVEIIEKTLRLEIMDADQSARQLTQVVKDIQELITQIAPDGMTPPQSQSSAPPAPVETAPQDVISAEDAPLVQDFITEAGEHIETSEAGLLALESKPGDNETLNLIFRAFHTIKGMAGFLNLVEIGSLAHVAENLLDLARKGELVLAGKTADVIFESIDITKKMIAALRVAVETGKPISKQPQLPDLLVKLKTVAENKGVDAAKDTIEEVGRDTKLDTLLSAPKTTAEESAEKSKVHTRDETIKVSTSRLDTLINMVGELVIAQLMIAEDAHATLTSEQSLGRNVAHQGKIIRELQELSMSMRMVPISGVFQKMTRLVRDLSHKAGKDIALTISGEDTELDRNIVDKIADPLVHMIRNSIDHGIEEPQDRARAGKNPAGQIKLRAFHQSGNIVIEIEDDGKGLNKDRILKKAIANGIVGADQQLSDQEIFKLIYHAGLSTAEKITSVSGRGVGMDVVKKNIESLRGRIDIHSVLGKGTTFTIRLPLTLAIIDGQIIKVGSERYIIPISSIVQSFRPAAGQISTIQGKGEMVMVRGQLLSLIRLHKLFGITSSVKNVIDALLVVVEEDGRKCCLLVDELFGQQQVVIKSVGDGLGAIKGVSGGAIMGDGKISLILDVPGLMGLVKS